MSDKPFLHGTVQMAGAVRGETVTHGSVRLGMDVPGLLDAE